MLAAPKGVWGAVQSRFPISLFPTGYRVLDTTTNKEEAHGGH